VVELDYKLFTKAQTLAAQIKSEIKVGNVVVLRRHPFEPLSLNVDEISEHFHFMKDQIVVATGEFPHHVCQP